TFKPPLLLPSTSRRADAPEVTLPPRKRLCIALDTWDEMVEDMQGTPAATDMAGLSQRMIDFDIDEIYGRLDDAQDDRLLTSGQLNSLRKDWRSHARITKLLESEAKASREAWVQSMDVVDTTRYKVRALQ
nr:hypothetical protein [Tanacetum cinerariifolium]